MAPPLGSAPGPPGNALVLYARVPRSGQVKTRMTPWLSAGEALRLHLALLEDSLALLREGAAGAGAVPFLAFSEPWDPGSEEGFEGLASAAAGLARLPQIGTDLGERLRDSFASLAAGGHRQVVVIGSDSPTLPPEFLVSAFAALRQADVVLGPAADGGYYLIGAALPAPEMFTGIPWGTDRVVDSTLAALARAGVRVSLLPRWHDVDVPADLDRLRTGLGRAGPRAGKTAAFIDGLLREGRPPCRAPDDSA